MDGNGHPTALTPAVHKKLITELQVGDWPAMAAIRADCSPRTVERWVSVGCDPYAVEPYKSFAADFVRTEAKICGELTAVCMGRALGKGTEGDAFWAFKMLETRFRFLWGVDKEGNGGGVAVAELVVRAIESQDSTRAEKARGILKQLPPEAKQEARNAGFLV
jgi:hypothetical protein